MAMTNVSGSSSFQEVIVSPYDPATIADQEDEHLIDVGTEDTQEPRFRPITTGCAIIFEFASIVGIFILSFVLPYVTSQTKSPTDAFSILLYTHSILWGVLLIIDCYLRREHGILNCHGYTYFYQSTKNIRRVTLYIFSAGNAILLSLTVILENYCENRHKCSGLSLDSVHYLQIIFVLEAIISAPFLIWYLVLTFTFNKRRLLPDIQNELYLLTHSQIPPSGDVGFRDSGFLEDTLEKQANMIYYLKRHNTFLGKKILKLSLQLHQLRAVRGPSTA